MARPKKTEQKKRGRKPKQVLTESQIKVKRLKERLIMVLLLTQEEFGLTDDEIHYAVLGLLDCNCCDCN